MARRFRRSGKRVPKNAVGVMKTRGGYRFVVKGPKVPRTMLRRKARRTRRFRRR